ncbi:MAG: type II toxin-antitoxin system VapC family toxin [Oscillospiraceae bacterium]|nr:type II toxin-antitoxin system VapC family toxin [Oscillospiraceae bacterium]
MKYMLDTNICIYIINKKYENVMKQFHDKLKNGICISAITLAELKHGTAKSQNPKKNNAMLSKLIKELTVIPFDSDAADEYGEICAYLQKKGTPIGTMDMLIAAHAKAEDLTLVTNNMREFERVPDLKLENWVE